MTLPSFTRSLQRDRSGMSNHRISAQRTTALISNVAGSSGRSPQFFNSAFSPRMRCTSLKNIRLRLTRCFFSQHLRVKLWAGVLWFLLLMIGGTALFVTLEHLSVVDAVYLTVVSVSTVGYGEQMTNTSRGDIKVRASSALRHARSKQRLIAFCCFFRAVGTRIISSLFLCRRFSTFLRLFFRFTLPCSIVHLCVSLSLSHLPSVGVRV